jgi:hypothetical protein
MPADQDTSVDPSRRALLVGGLVAAGGAAIVAGTARSQTAPDPIAGHDMWIWAGSLAYAPQWSAFALAVGAGAILQVMVEVTAYLQRQNSDRQAILYSPAVLGGFLGGIAFMYVTAALIKV